MARASMDKLNSLHDLLANYYSEILQGGDDLSSGELAAINAFLKNNDITATAIESDAVGTLQNSIANILAEQAKDKEKIG